MDALTKNVSEYIRNKGINISKISRDTGIPYSALYASLADEKRARDIRGSELIAISSFLGVDPRMFAGADEKGAQSSGNTCVGN